LTEEKESRIFQMKNNIKTGEKKDWRRSDVLKFLEKNELVIFLL
jgi:hypothetical protein